MRPTGSTDLETCPISEDLLRRFSNATLNVVAELGNQLPEPKRAALAVYCYRRAHFRRIGLALASLCSHRALVSEAGHAGDLIHRQASAGLPAELDKDFRPRGSKAPVSLHVI